MLLLARYARSAAIILTTASPKWGLGAWKHPGASTIGSQLLDEDCSHGWQILATQPWTPTQEEEQAPVTLLKQWNEGGKEGGRGTTWVMSCHTTKCQRTPPVCMPCYATRSTISTGQWFICWIVLSIFQATAIYSLGMIYDKLYNNSINAYTLIGQSALVYCASKLMEKLRIFWILFESNRPQVSIVYRLINQLGCW